MTPALSGPLPGPITLGSTSFDLGEIGYLAEEFRLAGRATAYRMDGPHGGDGRWTTTPASTADYLTRVVVYRPQNPRAFSGVATVEWINVSPSTDVAPMWIWAHREMARAGHLWIGVSAQRAGIEGGGFYPGPAPALKAADPERYGDLRHPGDAYAFDIFSQAARAVREMAGTNGFLPGYRPRTLLAMGASQSASFLLGYINTLGAVHRLFDGYMLSGRIGPCAGLDGVISDDVGAVRIRDDLGVPTITVQSETDVVGRRGSLRSRQPDSDRLRLWEVAGAAHMDIYNLVAGAIDSGTIPIGDLARALTPVDNLVGLDLGRLVNGGPQQHYVLQAALAHLANWASGGPPPPTAPCLKVLAVEPPAFQTDAAGHVEGGVRSPWVDTPRAVLSGFWRPDVQPPLSQFGVTIPFDSQRLAALYSDDNAYLERFDADLREAVMAGFILDADGDEIRALARAGLDAS